jgi:hypothetical protein
MTTDHFPLFAKLTAESFQELTRLSENAFVVDVSGDALYEEYLTAFPEGSNPLFKKTTEHDCSSCKHFIRRAGTVVNVHPKGEFSTVWDRAAEKAKEPYRTIATRLRDLVRAANILDLYRVNEKETSFGAVHSRSLDPETGKALTWQHLYTGEISRALRAASPDQVRGNYRTTVQVFERGLTELAPGAVETVLSLIDAKSLYRGEEHKPALLQFQKAQSKFFSKKEGRERSLFAWTNASALGGVAKFRNTVIGTLVQDLSEGQDLERAVKSFETKVAPQNYKRTTALITPDMVKKAMKTIEELDLESALERRFAVLSDVSVQDVKWVDGTVKPLMKGGIGDVLMSHATAATSHKGIEGDLERAEEIGLDEFVTKVLPETTSLELLFKGEHLGNLMSLTAPCHPEPKQLFRWTNDFAWSYRGGVADSFLRKQVQSLGGRVDGVLRFSHMWNHEKRNASLMDLHVFMPGSSSHREGCHDQYPHGQRVGWNRRSDMISGGVQDVDCVNAAPEGYVPVENITFPTLERLKNGPYTFKIHNWNLRQPTTGGFKAEIEFGGSVFQYDHPEPLRHKEWIALATATLKDGVFTIEHHHAAGTSKQEIWALTTEQYVKVSAVTLSPNYWGHNAVGNKHTFFVLEGARNDEATRGFYNEFLHPRLEPHRKVFEVIGDKTKCRPLTDGENQLSGLGFSSTKRESFLVRARQGKKQRVFHVHVGT